MKIKTLASIAIAGLLFGSEIVGPRVVMAEEKKVVACCAECCTDGYMCWHCPTIAYHPAGYTAKKDEVCWKAIRYSCAADQPPSEKTCGAVRNTEEVVCKPAKSREPKKQ